MGHFLLNTMMNEFHQLDENGLNNYFKSNMCETRDVHDWNSFVNNLWNNVDY